MKYIFFFFFLFASIAGHGQYDSTKLLQAQNSYGFYWKNMKILPNGALIIPHDTPVLAIADTGAIIIRNGCLYTWVAAKKWGLIGCAVTAPPLSITTQPVSQTVNVGDPVTFSVVAAGGTPPYTYQWFKNIVSIGGATSSTYTIGSVISGDAGNYNCVVQDAIPNFVSSNTAVLTVNTPITVTYAYSSTDPYTDDFTAPTAGTTNTTTITHNADLSITFPFAAENKFLWFKVPSGESTKVTWFVTSLNNGTIPDVAFRTAFTVSGFTYYVTRDPAGFAFDSSNPVQLNQ